MLCIKICSKILNNEMVSILQNSDEGKFAGSKGLEGNSNHGQKAIRIKERVVMKKVK